MGERIPSWLWLVGLGKRTHLDGRRVIVASRWALYRRDGGDPVSVLEFDSDVTETKRAQSMLKEREARLRSILETAPDAIIAIDERGIIQYFNKSAEKLFGYAPGQVIARNVKMLNLSQSVTFTSFRHQKPRPLASTGDMASLNLVLAGPIRDPPP